MFTGSLHFIYVIQIIKTLLDKVVPYELWNFGNSTIIVYSVCTIFNLVLCFNRNINILYFIILLNKGTNISIWTNFFRTKVIFEIYIIGINYDFKIRKSNIFYERLDLEIRHSTLTSNKTCKLTNSHITILF